MKSKSDLILFEDEKLLAVNKPPGLASSPAQGAKQSTASIVELLLEQIPALKQSPLPEWGLLHRLDTETSGVLLLAKTEKAYQWLKKNWRQSVAKFYRARVLSASPPQIQDIRWPIGNSKKSSKRVLVLREQDKITRRDPGKQVKGKLREAYTQIIRVEKVSGKTDPIWDLHLQLHTGVRHQIRAHLAAASFPILGDRIYGEADSPQLMLHAERLELSLPWNGKNKLYIEATLPSYWD